MTGPLFCELALSESAYLPRGQACCWEAIMGSNANVAHRGPWNKGKIVGQKAPFKLKDIWALRVRLQMESRVRELATSGDEAIRSEPRRLG